MLRLFKVSTVAHRYFWAHGLLSIIGFLSLRTAIYRHEVTVPFMVAFVTCVCKWMMSYLYNGGTSGPTEVTKMGGSTQEACAAFVRALAWPLAEALTTTSIAFNTVSYHFEFLFLAVCLVSTPGLLAAGGESQWCFRGEWLRWRPADASTATFVRRLCASAGTVFLVLGSFVALWGLKNENHYYQGNWAVAMLAVIILARGERMTANLASLQLGERRKEEHVPSSLFACLVLPVMSVLFADDYRFYAWDERPSALGILLSLTGCVARAGAQLLLEVAMARSRVDSPHGRVTRRDQVLLLVFEYFICLMYGYYYLCEHMASNVVPQAFLALVFLGLYYVALEASSNWLGRFVKLKDAADDENERGTNEEEETMAGGNAQKGTLEKIAIPTVPSLHNGFYSP